LPPRERVIVRFDEPAKEELAALTAQHWVWLRDTEANRQSEQACGSSPLAADKWITRFSNQGEGAEDEFYESLIEDILTHHNCYSGPFCVYDYCFYGDYDSGALMRAANANDMEYVRTDEYGRVFRDRECEELAAAHDKEGC